MSNSFHSSSENISCWGGGGGGGGGGSLPLKAVPDAQTKTLKKGIQIRGGRGSRNECQNQIKWGGGGRYQNRYNQSSSHAIIHGKVR